MSVKKVFKIIGIVLGCVTAFVGGVIGVMAAMGKFKTPVVKPEKIYFKNPEQVVVAQYKDDKGKEVIYSFTLVGTNSSYDHEVNVKDCFIWFHERIGIDLIELCDKDGNLLQADANGRYRVQCNENIYYKIKAQYEEYVYNASTWAYDYPNLYLLENGKYVLNTESSYDVETTYYTRTTIEELNPTLDPASESNGKVVLKARTADELHNAEKDLVIWVDRNVTSIFLNYGKIPTATNTKIQEQRINIGLDSAVTFDYVVNPEISFNPISKESKKIVELYYDDPKSEDYVLVNLENIKNETDYSLYQIFDKEKTEQTGELVFLSNKTTNGDSHAFKIAIFPSYNARAEYLASVNALLDNNVARLTRGMVVTDLYVEVVNTNVDKVSMSSGTVDLQLYSQNDFVYLSNQTAKENDLHITMESSGAEIDVRLDEVDFNAIKANRFYGSPKFVLERTQAGVQNEIDFSEYNIKNYAGSTLVLENKLNGSLLEFEINTSITVGNYKIINKITNAVGSYYCNNGIAFIDGEKQIKLLNVGSYLDFYIYDAANAKYTLATETDIKYSFTAEGVGVDKQWKVVVEYISPEILSGTETLVLGLMVANNDGMFIVENLFTTKTVRIGIDELAYVKLKSTENLDLVIGAINQPESITFDSLFEIGGGTYSACVLVISEDELAVAAVDYINAYFEISGKKYYIVGYQNADKTFVNDIRAKDNANVTGSTINNLMLLQLTNGFNSETGVQETANELISSIIKNVDMTAEHLKIDNVYVQNLINREVVTINQTLLINLGEININVQVDEYAVKPVTLYEKTDHTIKIGSSVEGLIGRLVNFYGITIDNIDEFIDINYDGNLIITKVSCDENILTLDVAVRETILANPDVTVDLIKLVLAEQPYNIFTFKILSSAPEDIVYYYENNKDSYITLNADRDLAPSVVAKISWVDNNYSTEWFVAETSIGDEFILNTQIAKDTYSGFQDPQFKIVNSVDYFVSGSSVIINENKLEINGADDSYLEVVIAGVKRYLKIQVDVTKFALTQENDTITGSSGVLKDIVRYEFNNGVSYDDIYNYELITLTKFIPQYRETLTCEVDGDVYNFKTESGAIIFAIEKSATDNDWVFKRISDLYASLSVSFEVVTKTHTIGATVRFEQSVIYQVNNVSWPDGKLYQGTTIQLYEIIKNDTDDFVTEALIKIRDKNGDSDVSVTASVGVLDNEHGTLQLDTLGGLDIVIKVGADVIATINEFIVVPNVVVKQDGTKDNTLIIGKTDAEVSSFVTFGEYSNLLSENPIVYGKTVDEDGKIVLYSTESVVSFTNNAALYLSTQFESSNNEVIKAQGAEFVTTGWIEQIGEQKEIVVTVKSGDYEVGSIDIVLKNNYQVNTQSGVLVGEDKLLNIKAMTDANSWLTIPGFTVSKIQWRYSTADENLTYINNSSLLPELNTKYENVTLLLELTGNTGSSFEGKTLIFEGKNINGIEDLTINIIPYELENKASINAYSENSFNILTGVYNVEGVDIDDYYQYIKVLSVKDANGNSLTNSTLGYAYDVTKGDTNGLGIMFNKISGDSVTAYITYEIKFVSGSVYTFEKEILLQNWQQIVVKYPEKDDSFEVLDVGCKEFVSGALKVLDIDNYEPILININSGVTLNLLEDNKKSVSRFSAFDRISSTADNLDITKLEIIAYQDVLGMASYANLVSQNINVEKGEIVFPGYSSLYGILVFRLTSSTGNYADYYIHVHSSGTNNAISASKTASLNHKYESALVVYNIANQIDGGFKYVFGEYATNVKMFLLNATTLADDNTLFNKDIFGEAVERYSCVNNKTLTITDYTTITLSLVYDDSYSVYPIGILTMYLRPADTVETLTGYSYFNDGIINGEYTTEIDANKPSIEFPSEFSLAENQNTAEWDSDIVTVNSNITLIKKVTTPYYFTVFYNKGNITLKVVYKYNAVSIPAETYVVVGELQKDYADDTKTKFNKEVVVDSAYFGDYQGDLKIGNATFTIGEAGAVSLKENGTIATGVGYSLSSSTLKLIFTQGLQDNEISIDFVFINLDDEDASRTQTYTFNVKAGVVVESESEDNSGVNNSQRLKTTGFDFETTITEVGSTVGVQKSNIVSGVKYVVGGYTIYINNAAGKLQFEFDSTATNYVLSDNTDNLQEISTASNINFVHLAQEYPIVANFKISNGEDFYKSNATTMLSKTLYLTIAQTYIQVEAVYLVENAADQTLNPTAENVIMGSKIGNATGESLAKYLFETESSVNPSAIKNTTKLRLKAVKADGSVVYIDDDFSAMGFLIYGNPNFVTFEVDENASILSGSNNTQYIQFNSTLNQNALCNVSINNNSGMSTCLYTFQVMAADKKDDIEFSTDGYVDEAETYMSFTISDNDTAAYASKEFLIGTINDGLAKGVYVLDSSGSTLYKFIPNLKQAAAESSHTFRLDGHNYIISFVDNQIFFKYEKSAGTSSIETNKSIKLYIHGSSDYILNGFEIVLFNVEIVPKSETRDTTVYGGQKINVLDKLSIPTGVNIELSIDRKASKYGTTSLDNVLGDSTTLIEVANEGLPYIQTKTVGKAVLVDLVFNIQIDDYYINSVTYQLQLNRSIQFFFNGEEGETGWIPEEIYEYSTNFVLTNKVDAKSSYFPLTYSFSSTANKEGVYYSDLSWKLEDYVGLSADAAVSKNSKKNNPSNDIVEILPNNAGVKFLKDYTGELNLLLTVTLTNGFNYSVNWKINVYGILTKTPQIDTSNGVITNNSLPYNSGDSISLISSSTGDSVGVQIVDKTSVFGSIIDYNAEVEYDYAILPYNVNDGLTNEARYSSVSASAKIKGDVPLSRIYTLNMPVVPSTSPTSTDRYLVVFRVKLLYLGYESEYYYVAYVVVNPLEISVATNTLNGTLTRGDNINVDNRLVNNSGVDDEIETNNVNLDLFKYTETYKATTGSGSSSVTTSYKLILSMNDGNPQYMVSVDGAAYVDCTLSDVQSNKITIDYGTGTTVTAFKDSSLTENQYELIDNKGTVDDTDDVLKLISVFNVKFENITEFADLINRINTINIGDKEFTIKHIADGRWGVDLTETGVLFNNKLEDEDLVLMAANDQPIYTLNHYNESANAGFRLHATTSLTAQGSKKISDLFISTNVEGYTEFKDVKVVGIYKTGNPIYTWVKNATSCTIVYDEVEGITIKVPKGDETDITYTLQLVTYEGAGTNPSLYELKENFYVIKSDYDAAVYRANYNKTVVQPFKDGENTVIDLNGLFKKFSNDASGAIIEENIVPTSCVHIVDEYNLEATLNSGKLTVTNSKLLSLRVEDDSLRNVFASYKMTFTGGLTLYCEFTFGLYPEEN